MRLMMFLLLFNPLVIQSSMFTVDEVIANNLIRLNKNLDYENVVEYSNALSYCSETYKLDWRLVAAILYQESGLNHRAISWKSRDYGIGQLHYKTIINRNVDLGKLLTDSAYAIDETCKLLKSLKDKYNYDNVDWRIWYTRYHSYTPKYRMQYYKLIQKHINRLKNVSNKNNIST